MSTNKIAHHLAPTKTFILYWLVNVHQNKLKEVLKGVLLINGYIHTRFSDERVRMTGSQGISVESCKQV